MIVAYFVLLSSAACEALNCRKTTSLTAMKLSAQYRYQNVSDQCAPRYCCIKRPKQYHEQCAHAHNLACCTQQYMYLNGCLSSFRCILLSCIESLSLHAPLGSAAVRHCPCGTTPFLRITYTTHDTQTACMEWIYEKVLRRTSLTQCTARRRHSCQLQSEGVRVSVSASVKKN